MREKSHYRLAIVGNGAIGNLLAYQCDVLNIDYQLLLRHQQQICLKVEDTQQQRYSIIPKTSLIGKPAPFDIVILPVKSYQVADSLKQLHPHIQPNHIIVLLHNGMGTIEQVSKRYPNQSLIAATTSYGAFKPDPQSLNITGLGQTHLGWINQAKGIQTTELETLLAALLPPSTWYTDITQALWNKLAINAVINPLTAIHNIKNGQLAAAEFSPQIEKICVETARVMTVEGYKVSAAELQKRALEVIQATANNYSSMHQDIAFKRVTEIDFINGYLVKKSREHAIYTPVNQQLVSQIKTLEQSTQ